MRLFPRTHRKSTPEVEPFDAVALSLAVWLGVIAVVTGAVRFSNTAAANQAALRAEAAPPAIAMQLAPFGS